MLARLLWTRREERRWIRQAVREAMKELALEGHRPPPDRAPAGAPPRDSPPEGSADPSRRT